MEKNILLNEWQHIYNANKRQCTYYASGFYTGEAKNVYIERTAPVFIAFANKLLDHADKAMYRGRNFITIDNVSIIAEVETDNCWSTWKNLWIKDNCNHHLCVCQGNNDELPDIWRPLFDRAIDIINNRNDDKNTSRGKFEAEGWEKWNDGEEAYIDRNNSLMYWEYKRDVRPFSLDFLESLENMNEEIAPMVIDGEMDEWGMLTSRDAIIQMAYDTEGMSPMTKIPEDIECIFKKNKYGYKCLECYDSLKNKKLWDMGNNTYMLTYDY